MSTNSKELYFTLAPAIRLCKAVALLPGTYSSKKGFRIQSCNILYSIFVLIMVVSFALYRIVQSWSYFSQSTFLSFAPMLLDPVGTLLSNVVCLGTSLVYHSNLLHQFLIVIPILDNLTFFDSSGYKCLSRSTKTIIFSILLVWVFQVTVNALKSYVNNSYRQVYFKWFMVFLNILPCMKFFAFVCVLRSRFKHLNSILQSLWSSSKEPCAVTEVVSIIDKDYWKEGFENISLCNKFPFKNKIVTTNHEYTGLKINTNVSRVLRTLRNVHYCLNRLAIKVERAFKLQNFIDICTIFLFIIQDVYVISGKIYPETNIEIQFNVNMSIFISITFIFDTLQDLFHLFLICWASKSLICESRRTRYLISQLQLKDNMTPNVLNELNKFQQQASTFQVNFSAGDFFNIDLKLFFAMMSTLVTYTVVIIQFGDYIHKGSSPNEQLVNTTDSLK